MTAPMTTQTPPAAPALPVDSKKRSIVKTITWRTAATLTTFLISILVFAFFRGNDANGALKAAGIVAGIEVPSKLILYYVHERVWTNLRFGRTA